MISKDEFLDNFIKAAGLPQSARTPEGVRMPGFYRIAVPCDQGTYDHTHYDGKRSITCSGWQLVEPPKDTHEGGVYSVKTHT